MATEPRRWIVALTGASGVCYARRLIGVLISAGIEVHIVISDAGLRVLHDEEGVEISPGRMTVELLTGHDVGAGNPAPVFYNIRDIGARIASGSALFGGMVIIPCSMGTLAAIAQGLSQNLIHRAADVTLKEGRRLVMVPRETPLSAIHLENMLKLSRLGVRMVPAMPGFYHRPETLSEIIDMQVMKVLDQMGVPSDLVPRWSGRAPTGGR